MKTMMCVEAPFGRIYLAQEGAALTHLCFSPGSIDDGKAPVKEGESDLLREAAKQLGEYFAGKRKSFALPLEPAGTSFQKKVWQALREIPYGETCSYKDIAHKVGSPQSMRAVGGANHRNPISIIVPCHRVVGANGKLVGYGGGLEIKSYLLALESQPE